jgi:hypothetical protein
MRVIAGLSFAIACALLYFGTGFLFFMPGRPGDPYLNPERIAYGIFPVATSVALLFATGWFWAQKKETGAIRNSVVGACSLAVGTVILIWLGLMIRSAFRQA